MMRGNIRFVTVLAMAFLIGFCGGCGKQDPAPVPQAVNAAPAAGTWKAMLPEKFAGLTVKDGGACYLDAFNDSAIVEGPIMIKSGSRVSFGGWAVADLKGGLAGGAVAIQLNAATPYFTGAVRYKRAGLGAALNGNTALDDGGLKLDSGTLNVPPGDYRVLFLIQSDLNLFRCDTGRTLRIQ